MSEQFDLIVLGSGSGARDGANKAAKEHDARVALKMGATVDDLAHMHHAFPTWGEGVKSRRGAGPGFAGVEGGYDRRFALTPARRR